MDQVGDLLVPNLTIAMLDALDRMYPERCAEPSDTERDLWIKVGRRQVVRFLREQFNRQLTG